MIYVTDEAIAREPKAGAKTACQTGVFGLLLDENCFQITAHSTESEHANGGANY